LSIGLVLNGGGGKGAYQIGVWKHLKEKNISLDYISGTSAGGLNAALIASGDLDKAIGLWTNLKPGTVREIDNKRILAILYQLVAITAEALFLRNSSKTKMLGKEIARSTALLLKSRQILSVFIEKGIFSIQPLRELIKNNIDVRKLPKHPTIFLTVVKNHPLYFFGDKQYINFTYSHNSIKEGLLLATSAIPLVFPNCEIGNVQYSDGGIPKLGDNSPVDPLYIRDCKTLIVVHSHPRSKTNKKNYSRSEIIDISPKDDLGSFLKFDGKSAKRLIDLGYKDAKRIIR